MFWRTQVLFLGPPIPLFWASGDVCPGFQSQGGSLACFLACVILRFTSGTTPADCIEVSTAAKPFLIHVLADVSTSIGGGSGLEPTTIPCRKHGSVSHSATPAQITDEMNGSRHQARLLCTGEKHETLRLGRNPIPGIDQYVSRPGTPTIWVIIVMKHR